MEGKKAVKEPVDVNGKPEDTKPKSKLKQPTKAQKQTSLPEDKQQRPGEETASRGPTKVSRARVKAEPVEEKTVSVRRSRRSRKCRQEPVKQDKSQTSLTEYYQVRRSSRKCTKVLQREKLEALVHMIKTNCEDGLEERPFNHKGRGVVTTCPRSKDEFICEYAGELITYEQAKVREKEYSADSDTGCYMYYFEYKGTKYCVDATAETGRMGRLINHSKTQGNLTTRLQEVDGTPHLCFFAVTSISEGAELLYDYGERSRDIISAHPWLSS